MMIQRHSLRRYLVGYSFLFSSLIVVLLGVFSYLFFVNDTKRLVLNQMTALANVKRENLDRWIDRKAAEFAHLSDTLTSSRRLLDFAEAIGTDAEDITHAALLEEVSFHLAYHPGISELFYLSDPGGRVLFSSRPESVGDYRVMSGYYTEATTDVYVKNVYPSPVTLKPTMTFSVGVYRESRDRIGVLGIHINLDMMDAIVRNEEGLGHTGESYLIDRYNTIVSSTRFGTDQYPRGVHSKGIDAATGGESGSGIYRNYKNRQVLGIYQWLEEHELALVVEMGVREAFAAARRQSFFFAIIGLALIVALGGGVYLIAARIERPIVELRNAASHVAGGNLHSEVPIPKIDELAGLAGSFNHMVSRLRGLYDELRMKEEYYRSLIENSSDIVLIVDEDGAISYVSPSIKHVLGYEPQSVVGTNLLELAQCDEVAETTNGGLRGFLNDLVGMRTGSGGPLSNRLGVRHADDSWRDIEVVGSNLSWHPAVRGIVLNFRDVTEKQELLEKLNQAQKLEAVGRLAGGIAHDFNNILTAIMGNAELIRLEEELGSTSIESLSQISESAERATNLTQQLLAYSRKQVLKPRVIDLNDLIRSIVGILRRLIGEDTRLETDLSDDLLRIRIDPSQMEQVIMNLAINARDAMPEGGSISISTRNASGAALPPGSASFDPGALYVEMQVSDTGVGMSEELQKKIFDPFFTTKEVGKGTGLGLSTVLGIVKQSEGYIEVESEVARGTSFALFFPSVEEPVDDGHHGIDVTEGGTGRILVVEDDRTVRRMMELTLGRSGYDVVTAADADEALRLFFEGRDAFDLVITDLVMPGDSGYDLSRKIRSVAPDLEILFMSGYAELRVARGTIDFDSDRFMHKPFTPTQLLYRVADILSAEEHGG